MLYAVKKNADKADCKVSDEKTRNGFFWYGHDHGIGRITHNSAPVRQTDKIKNKVTVFPVAAAASSFYARLPQQCWTVMPHGKADDHDG